MEGNDSSQEKCEKIQFTEPSLQVFFEVLDLHWIEDRIAAKYSAHKRRPPLPFLAQIRAHLFKDLRQIKSFRKLAKTLAEHEGLWARQLGFTKPPHHDSFSAFRSHVGSELFLEIFIEIRRRTLQLIPEFAKYIVIDSTPIHAYGRDRRGRSSDPDATWGRTTNTKNGDEEWFYGYKLHAVLAAPYGAPLAFTITPGHRNDSPQFPKLIRTLSAANITFDVAIADKGYDARENYTITLSRHAKPIIAYNRRSKPKGTTGRRFDGELPVLRNSRTWKQYYNLRSAVERQFSELKEQLGMRNLTLRGMERVTIHLTISMTVLLAINLVAHLTGNPELLRSIEPWRYSNV